MAAVPAISLQIDGDEDDQWTVEVEQEFFLVDRRTREPIPGEPEWVADSAPRPDDVDNSLPPRNSSDPTPLGARVLYVRKWLMDRARAHGCRLIAAGAAPLSRTTPAPPRGGRPRRHPPRPVVDIGAVCGCHIRLGPADLETTLEVSNRLRPWLPILLALSANSPIRHGLDTGYASWRYLTRSRSPVGGPPPYFDSPAEYQQLVGALIAEGTITDEAMLRWDVRPAPGHAAIDLRIPDIALTAEEVELLVELGVALVLTAVADATIGRPPPRPPDGLVRAASLRAARDGLRGMAVSMTDGALVPSWQLVDKLIRHVRPVLERRGRADAVDRRLEWLRANGCGADRQRQVYARDGDPRRLVDFLAEHTTEYPVAG
jgi:carboxylate-amine ligase